jgi:hypothetical protein
MIHLEAPISEVMTRLLPHTRTKPAPDGSFIDAEAKRQVPSVIAAPAAATGSR